ncbi:Sulphatase-modifying factor domain protein [Candidatus Magnetomorum sp. HK-1]|nr:Sulphatase-modifying factor domain protein [Candidatus Magnetomorum sp. HK-1]
MIRFCFPNVMSNDYIGLGVFFVGSPDDASFADEELADPNTSDPDGIYEAIKKIAPDALDSKKKVYQNESYVGDSMGFAYLLACIHCSRKIFFNNDSIEINIWCTGSIKQSCSLSSVFQNGFDLKLNAFISESEDKLFLVPFSNIKFIHEKKLNERNIRILSLKELKQFPKKDILKQKTIIKIHTDELHSLVNFFFVDPIHIQSYFHWLNKRKKLAIYLIIIAVFGMIIFSSKSINMISSDLSQLIYIQSTSQETNKHHLKKIQAGIHLLLIQGGCYDIDNEQILDATQSINSKYQICLDSFWISQSEITQGQWKEVMGKNPAFFKNCGLNCPVENISWDDADRFIRILNENHSKGEFRLISDAQWEYVCQKNIREDFFEEGRNVKSTYPIDPFAYKSTKLIGLTGNVLEWCEDSFLRFPYEKNVNQNPRFLDESPDKVVRGISWSTPQMYRICSHRFKYLKTERFSDLGLRIVWNLKWK